MGTLLVALVASLALYGAGQEQAGQPPWGVQIICCGQEQAGQPPWGVQGQVQAGQPPWGVKGQVQAGQPPWCVQGQAQAGQPPWGVKGQEQAGQPPWGVKGQVQAGQPPWGVKGQEQAGQPPWGVKGQEQEGQPPWGVKGQVLAGQPPWGVKGRTVNVRAKRHVLSKRSILSSPYDKDSNLKCDNTTNHEVLACRFPCPPQRTCQNFRGPEPPCVPPSQPCTKQCVCADGYARNKWGGSCVTYAQCDQCPGYNQYFSCDGPYSEDCTGSCHCAEGYERDANNTCVSTTPPPVDTHPSPPPPPIVLPSPPVEGPQPITTGPRILTCNNVTKHEMAACTYGCPPEKTCQNRNWPPIPCAPPPFPCTPKCICDHGYARNQDGGTCVTLEQCDRCGENEYFECYGDYDENCVGHCYCFSGYTRDINDKCVYVNPATPPKDNGPPAPEPEDSNLKCDNTTNHEVLACRFPCPPQRTCQNFRGPEPPCVPPSQPCTKQCVCADGYARNKWGGSCVTYAQCDKCPGYNQYFSCDGPYSEDCTGCCHCAEGYERDANNTCVSTTPPPVDTHPSPPPPPIVLPSPPVEGPQPVTTGPRSVLLCNTLGHEVSACMFEYCPPERTCLNMKLPLPLCGPTFLPCKPKCVCDEGYARNQEGSCVTIEQCEKCGDNEIFQCDGDYSEDCVGICNCLSGYTRDINDKCIYVDPASHPKDFGPPDPEPVLTCNNVTKHEMAACTYSCPPEKTCQNRNWPPIPCAPPAFPCTPKCICEDGYARNQDGGTCVTLEQCDRCGENEYFECDGCYDENCVGHCYCFSGYTRDINDKCVYVDPATPPKDNGPPAPEPEGTGIKCDNTTLHEVPACVYPCPTERTCQNSRQPQPPCQPSEPWVCTPTCVCAAGYARNQIGGTCVTYEQCDKCPGLSQYFACDGSYSEYCTGVCHCAAGYERDANNICVTTTPTPLPRVYCPPPPLGRPYPIHPVPPVLPVPPVEVDPVDPFELDYYQELSEMAIFFNL